MNHNCPSMKEAMQLWQDGIKYRLEHFEFPNKDEYIFHTQGIAFHARLLASYIPGLNQEHAYICGLLHDYGKKYNEREIRSFHGLLGYKELSAMGYSLPARICLSHTFAQRDFDFVDYPSYPLADLQECKKILSDIEYDDYDRLIQFIDLLFEGLSMTTYQIRIRAIQKRYQLGSEVVGNLLNIGDTLKTHFDQCCGKDVYQILGLK